MNLVMANLMQQYRRTTFAAAQAGNKVVQALFGACRDRALAQGADRQFGFHKAQNWLQRARRQGGCDG